MSAATCLPCTTIYPNCLYCTTSECTDCAAGYYSTDNKNCVPNCIVLNCQLCAPKNNILCSTCRTGYELKNGQCTIIPCLYGLQFNGAECVCPPTQYLTIKLVCQNCVDLNCLFCTALVCKTCLQGYYLAASSICIACPFRCRVCLLTGCQLCDDGFFVGITGCQPIVWNVVTESGIIL